MSWVSPTGFNDPGSEWDDETNAFDENTATYAKDIVSPTSWSDYLELTVPVAPINAIRFYAQYVSPGIDQISIDVYYDGGWVNIYEGSFSDEVWETKNIPAGEKYVSQARVKFYNSHVALGAEARLHEFDFWSTKMDLVDTNVLIRNYLLASSVLTDPLIALIGARLYCPRLPENATLPAISYFTRGGIANPDVPNIFSPSVQFDCWADNPIEAREVYRDLYDALQGLGNAAITIGGTTYYITKAREEVQGQDLVDVDIPNYFRVLTFYSITIRDNL